MIPRILRARPDVRASYLQYFRPKSTYSYNLSKKKAVVLGLYEGKTPQNPSFNLTQRAQEYVSKHGTALIEAIQNSGPPLKEGAARIMPSNVSDDHVVVVVGLGKDDEQRIHSVMENRDLSKERVRVAVSTGVRSLQAIDSLEEVYVDDCGDAESSAEGAFLSIWSYDSLKAKKNSLSKLKIEALGDVTSEKDWKVGKRKALGQNLARTLMEAPSNILTPSEFARVASKELSSFGVEVIAHDRTWIESQKMGSFLSVTQGSHEEPVFLEMIYKPVLTSNLKPVALVGKGVTFDTGGISIKPSAKMDEMRADMGGAANVVGALQTVASLGLPMEIRAFTPLCENMPGGKATKPGDVVKAMNGKTIQVDNTDAEGRLILADALCYAEKFSPRILCDLATLTGAMSVALGPATSGVFTNSSKYWPILEDSAFCTGDRVWRMPLWKFYGEQMKKSRLADLNNISGRPGGGACTAAAFLKEFVTCNDWFHFDIAGVADNSDEVPYLPKGMSGRPSRTLAEFLLRIHAHDS